MAASALIRRNHERRVAKQVCAASISTDEGVSIVAEMVGKAFVLHAAGSSLADDRSLIARGILGALLDAGWRPPDNPRRTRLRRCS